MGILSKLFGAPKPPDRYRTEAEYKRNRLVQAARGRELAAELVQDGAQAPVQLAFGYRTKKKANAKKLTSALTGGGLPVESARDGDAFLVTGESKSMAPTEEAILNWIDDLCRFGYEHDAELELVRLA